MHPGIERIDAAELPPLVLQFARQHFESYNRRVFRDPHVHFLQEDARWVVACQKQTYDCYLLWRVTELSEEPRGFKQFPNHTLSLAGAMPLAKQDDKVSKNGTLAHRGGTVPIGFELSLFSNTISSRRAK